MATLTQTLPRNAAPPPAPPSKKATPRAGGGPPIDGIPSFGTVIQVLSSGPGVTPEMFTTIAGMGDITGPGNSIAEIDVTSHSSGAPIKQTLPGLIDLGDLSFPCYWNPADPTQNVNSPFGLEYLFINRITTKFREVMVDPTHRTREFWGFVKSLAEDAKVSGVYTRQVSIRICTPMVDVEAPVNLTPASLNTPAAALPSGTVAVATGGNATPWTAVSDAPWLTVSAPTAPQTGDGDITYAVAANATGTPRTGHINVTGLNLTFTVTQADV